MIQLCRHDQRQVGIILSNKDNNIMTNKYFSYQNSFWQIVESQSPWGEPLTYAVEMDSAEVTKLNKHKNSKWEFLEDSSDIEIDRWLLESAPEDLFCLEEDPYVDPKYKPTLKEMLENLRQPPPMTLQWDEDASRHDRLKATMNNADKVEDILGMIHARQQNTTFEMPPTVILSPSKLPDAKSLEEAIKTMRERHGDNANIRVAQHNADALLATYKNQETIGVSSIMKLDSGITIDFTAEILELIIKLRPKK